MAREWQQRRFAEYVMPDAVYYQSLWAVRDLARMEKRIRELDREITGDGYSASIVREGRRDYAAIRPTEKKAVEKITLEKRVEAIRRALDTVPENYRDFVYANIVYKKQPVGYQTKIWKIWKQRFLFHVARNLSMM